MLDKKNFLLEKTVDSLATIYTKTSGTNSAGTRLSEHM